IVCDARHDSPLGPPLIGPVTEVVDEHLRAFHAAPDTALVVGASGGDILGFALATRMRPRVLAHVAYPHLDALYVRPGTPRSGAGAWRSSSHAAAAAAACPRPRREGWTYAAGPRRSLSATPPTCT